MTLFKRSRAEENPDPQMLKDLADAFIKETDAKKNASPDSAPADLRINRDADPMGSRPEKKESTLVEIKSDDELKEQLRQQEILRNLKPEVIRARELATKDEELLTDEKIMFAGAGIKSEIDEKLIATRINLEKRYKEKNKRAEESRKWKEKQESFAKTVAQERQENKPRIKSTYTSGMVHKGEGFGRPYPKRSPILENPPKKQGFFKKMWSKLFG